MILKLKELLNNSYSPFSKYQVSSIVLTKDGKEYSGVNVESSTFGATICAERNAIFSAISAGVKKGEVTEIHLLARNNNNPMPESFTTPCGICRQIISEQSNNQAKIFVYNENGDIKETTISKLLPEAFNEGDLIV